jgi:hypothetical protein
MGGGKNLAAGKKKLHSSVQCRGSGIRCFFLLWIQDPEMGSRMELGIKILEFFYADTGSFQPWIRDKHPGSSTLLCLENSTEMLDDFSTSSFICKQCCFSSDAVL